MRQSNGDEFDPQLLEQVQNLIAFNLQIRSELLTAAEVIDHPNLSRLFVAIAEERRSQARELKGYVAASGATPVSAESLNGSARKQILKVRDAIGEGDPKVVLSEAERAEDLIRSRYERVLRQAPEPPIHDVLQRQYRTVKRQHDVVRDLRDAYLN